MAQRTNKRSNKILGNKNKKSLYVVILVLLVIAVASLLVCWRTSRPILIGVALNLSGHGAARGQAIKEGIVIAVKELNQAGGINGRSIKLIIADDQNTKEGVIRADKKLLRAGCPVIIGHNTSQNTLIAYPIVVGSNKILITSCTSTTELSGRDDYFFRTSVDNARLGKAWAMLMKNRNIHAISLLVDLSNKGFAKDLTNQIKRFFNGQVFETVINTKKYVDWNKAIKGLMSNPSQLVLLITNPKDTAIALQKLRFAGYNSPVFATTWAQGQELFSYGGDSVEGLKVLTFVPPIAREVYQRINPAMKKYFQRNATICTVRGYELTMMVADAMKRCNSRAYEPACIKEKLLSGQYNILSDTVKFDRFGDIIRPIYEIEVKEGKFVVNRRIL